MQTKRFAIGALSLFALSMISPVLNSDSNRLNLYVHQARAFLEGRLDITNTIDEKDNIQDTSLSGGKRYVAFPPFPAVLLIPFVALFEGANTVLIALLLTVTNVYLFLTILRKLEVPGQDAIWLCIALFLGTAYWMTIKGSDQVTYFAHIVCVSLVITAIRESLFKSRGWLIGICLGCAFLSRQMTLYTLFFFVPLIWFYGRQMAPKMKVFNISVLLVVFGLCVLCYLYYNSLRFDDPFDTGYSHMSINAVLSDRVEKYGNFHAAYLPFNFVYMFFQGPHLIFEHHLRPSIMDPYGTSITFASPFVFGIFWAKGKKELIYGAGLAIALAMMHILMYYNNGWVQLNAQRFTLDFILIVMFLLALSIKQLQKKIFYAAIAYAVTLNLLSMAIVPLGKVLYETVS